MERGFLPSLNSLLSEHSSSIQFYSTPSVAQLHTFLGLLSCRLLKIGFKQSQWATLTTATGCPQLFAFAFLPFKQFQCSYRLPLRFHWQNSVQPIGLAHNKRRCWNTLFHRLQKFRFSAIFPLYPCLMCNAAHFHLVYNSAWGFHIHFFCLFTCNLLKNAKEPQSWALRKQIQFTFFPFSL